MVTATSFVPENGVSFPCSNSPPHNSLPHRLCRSTDHLRCCRGLHCLRPSAPLLVELDSLSKTLLFHVRWAHIPSPFISLFADERHARNWALGRGDLSVRMIVIDLTRLPARQVLCAVDAYQKLGIEVPANARNEHEYLCLNGIPAAAVMREIGCGDLEHARVLGEQSNVGTLYRQGMRNRMQRARHVRSGRSICGG